MPVITQQEITQALLDSIPAHSPNGPATAIVSGSHLVGVDATPAGRMGLASRIGPKGLHSFAPDADQSVLDMARSLSASPSSAAQNQQPWAMAALNSLIPVPDISHDIKGQELILDRGAGKNVAVVGHFPFVERMGDQFHTFNVLELTPVGTDLPATEAKIIIPQADLVAITGTTIANGTLAGILTLCSSTAFVIILGPSTPFSENLFNFGVDALAGAVVQDPHEVSESIRLGLPFKKMKGTRSVTVLREK